MNRLFSPISFFLVILLSGLVCPSSLSAQLARGSGKFFGSGAAHNAPVQPGFKNYFNQVTPENSGKWVSVEAERDVMVWTSLDTIYHYSKRNGFPFKQHTFVWGIQQPGWITGISQAEQKEEVEEWIEAFCARYTEVDFIDPANEPIHQPPPYKEALGGNGATGWDWLLWVHRKARESAPEATLILNEFDVLKNRNTRDRYMDIAALLLDSGLVDALGCQGHWLEGTSTSLIQESLDTLATLGLDIFITELDLSYQDDQAQLEKYQEIFPVLWEHPAVKGITLWDYREGQIWRENAFLIRRDGSERPAMEWLRKTYFASAGVPYARITHPAGGTFLKEGEVPVTVEVTTDQEGPEVRAVEFYQQEQFLARDEGAPFNTELTYSSMDTVYRIHAIARGDSASYATPGVLFGFLRSGNAFPWQEQFDHPDGTFRDGDSTAWNTLSDTEGTFAVQEGRFIANNLDKTAWWSCLVPLPETGSPDLSLEVMAEGGLDEGEDYLKVLFSLDGSAPVTLFTGEALFNNGEPLLLEINDITGDEIQLILEVYNTGGSEIYSWDNIRVAADPTGISAPLEVRGVSLFPNPAGERFALTLNGQDSELNDVAMYDLRGRQVYSVHSLSGPEVVLTPGLGPGIYLVEARTREGHKIYSRIIIK